MGEGPRPQSGSSVEANVTSGMPKPQRPRRPVVEEPSLLICHEKHGDLHFHVPDEDAVFHTALDIVTKRLKAGHWYVNPKDYEPKNPGMTKEQAEALPEGPIRKAALQEIASHQRQIREYEGFKESWDAIHKAISEKDGRLAWQVLRDYSDGEYQRVSIERYCDAYPE